ncbi:MAG: cation transporter [Cytophagales bacterium]|nr:MAG: cation transporter [Cytophagales bacterium]TAF60177.1 MAG: cation transporter [Cytophagales bacterium]
MRQQQIAERAVYFSIAGNGCLVLIKGFAGFFGNSYALMADAIESTTDVLASILVLVGLRYSNRPADQNHPYGHGRIEPLVTFMVVGFLIVSALVIAYESIQKIRTPHELPEFWTLFVLAPIIIWKEISFQVVLKKSKKVNSSSLKAEAWHHRSDAATSVAAFIGVLIALCLGKGYETADDWAALMSSGFILYNSYQIFRPALGEIMDEHVYDDLTADIKEVSASLEGILGTEKCFVRKVGLKYHIELYAIVDSISTIKEGHAIAQQLKDRLQQKLPQLGHIAIHLLPND